MSIPGQDPRTPFPLRGRTPVYVFMGVCAAAGVTTLLGRGGSGSDPYWASSEESFSSILAEDPVGAGESSDPGYGFVVPSRDAEAVGLGYLVESAWREVEITQGQTENVTLNGRVGVDYLILAGTTLDCDADIHVSDEIQDVRLASDAAVQFSLTYPGPLAVELRVYSDSRATCTVGYGIYAY